MNKQRGRKKGTILSKDTKLKISLSHKGKIHTIEHRKNNSLAHKRKVMSKEARLKISNYQKDRLRNPISEETKTKISNKLTGRIMSKEIIEKIRKSMTGKKHTNETKEKIRLSHKGKVMSEESKLKISNNRERAIKISKAKKGKKLSTEHKAKLSKVRKKLFREGKILQHMPKKDTSIEIKIQNFLKKLQIEFFTHKYINIYHGYQCDILIPSLNLVVECDGNYWHKYPIGNKIDHIRTKELLDKGFKVLRLWESEIKDMNLDKFEEVLNENKHF